MSSLTRNLSPAGEYYLVDTLLVEMLQLSFTHHLPTTYHNLPITSLPASLLVTYPPPPCHLPTVCTPSTHYPPPTCIIAILSVISMEKFNFYDLYGLLL